MKIWVIIFCCCLSTVLYPQDSSEQETINKDIWYNFMQAYQDLDATLFQAIHTDKTILIDTIQVSLASKDEILEAFNRWNRLKVVQRLEIKIASLDLTDGWANETGTYTLTRYQEGKSQTYLGTFDIILKKVGKRWKIYDIIESQLAESDEQ